MPPRWSVNPQDEVGPSISSSVVICSFVLLVYIVVLVLVICLCPSSVYVVATFSGTVLFLTTTLLPRPRRLWPRDPWAMQLKLQQTGEGAGESAAPKNWTHSAKGAHPYRKACSSRGIKMAAPPLDSHCDGPVTYPGDIKILNGQKEEADRHSKRKESKY